jgi:hypothetical protein
MNAPVDEARRSLDAQVASVLRACGGWNDESRRRLAALAQLRRVPPSELASSMARVAAAWGAPATGARSELPADGSPSSGGPAGAARPSRGSERVRPRARPAGIAGPAVGIAVLLATSILSAGMLWYAVRRAESTSRAVEPATGAADARGGRDASAADRVPEAASASGMNSPAGMAVAPGGSASRAEPRDVPPVPAVYARPPALRVDASPAWSRTALESLAGDEPALESTRAAVASGAAAGDADRALVVRVIDAIQGAWPLLQGVRRDQLLRDACAIARTDAALVDRMRVELTAARDAVLDAPDQAWRGSAAAGLLAALDAPAAEAEAFVPAARGWLMARTGAVADAVLSGDAVRAAESVEAWLAAVGATTVGAGASADPDGPAIALLDLLLRRDAPFTRPGVAADAAGTLLDSLGWTSRAERRASIAGAFRAWLEDPSVPSQSLHGLTSVLASRRPGAWWDPWLVCGARADAAARARAAARWATALAGSDGTAEDADARARGIPAEAIDRWMLVARAVDARSHGTAPAERMVRAAERIALVEAARCLERGRFSDAESRLAQVEDPDGLGLDDLDRWKGRARRDPPRTPGIDGQLRDELRRRAAFDDHAAFLRSLRTRSIGDLGPLDAAELAHEALCAASPQVRSVAQGVVVDVFAEGPNVLAALAAAVPDASDPAEAAAVASQVCGQPPPRGTSERLRTAAVLMLLDRHAALAPSDRHRLDAVSTEFAYSAAAGVRAAGGQPPPAESSPEAAFRAWFDARVAEARPVVPSSTLASIVARADARRALASPGPQAFVAEQAALLDVDAALVAERAPRVRSAVGAIVQRAAAERASAPDVFAQVESNARALQELAALSLAPGEVQR